MKKKHMKHNVKSLPKRLEEIDALRYQKLVLQKQNLNMQQEVLQQQIQALSVHLNQKYKLGADDQVNITTGEIIRVKGKATPQPTPDPATEASPPAVPNGQN